MNKMFFFIYVGLHFPLLPLLASFFLRIGDSSTPTTNNELTAQLDKKINKQTSKMLIRIFLKNEAV